MKKHVFVLALVALIAGSATLRAQTAVTTTVRGQLLHGGQFPAPGIQVTLYSVIYGRSSPAYTGADGMYYLNNVPLGDYALEVWIATPPVAYPVRVSAAPYFDIARIPVP